MREGDKLDDERRKIINKGRSWLVDYLNMMAEDSSLGDRSRKQLFKVMGDRYRKNMEDDPEFYERVRTFVSERRTAAEKSCFYRDIASVLVSQGIAEEYAKRYPDEYRVN